MYGMCGMFGMYGMVSMNEGIKEGFKRLWRLDRAPYIVLARTSSYELVRASTSQREPARAVTSQHELVRASARWICGSRVAA